jgi:Cytochrome bd-type quinol oxidase, subunit 2
VFVFHGATYLTLKTTGDLLARAKNATRLLSILAAAGGAAFLISTVFVAVNRTTRASSRRSCLRHSASLHFCSRRCSWRGSGWGSRSR